MSFRDRRRRSRSPRRRSRSVERSRRRSPERRRMDRERFDMPPPLAPIRKRVVEIQPPAPLYSSFPGSSTVWIGSIPESASSEEDVYDRVIELAGSIEGMRILNNRGFGYIRFQNETLARRFLNKAIDYPLIVGGRKIRLDACEDMPTLPHPYRPDMSKKPSACTTLFVGNLPIETTEEDIESLFNSQLREGVKVSSTSLRRGGYKGMSFAHVRFSSPSDCEAAVAAVSGSKLRGNRIRIDWAVDKGESASAGGPASRVSEDLRGKTCKIYIGNLNENIDESDLMQHMQQFGPIQSAVKLHRDKSGNRSFGYVIFESPESAAAAIEKSTNLVIKGVKIRTDFARPERTSSIPAHNIINHEPSNGARRLRSPSPDMPRTTPVSFDVPSGYGPMRSWIECYGDNMVNGTASA